jgi:hypothetical protein
MALHFQPKCHPGQTAELWTTDYLNFEEWLARGQPEMWVLEAAKECGGQMFRLDKDLSSGKLRIVDLKNNVILSVGIDVVFYETEKLTVVGLSNKYLSRPQLLAREKFEYKKS